MRKPLPATEVAGVGSTPLNRIVAGQSHDHSGGGGNRTCPNCLETSGTVGSQRKVSAGAVNLLDPSRWRVDAVNKGACASAYWRSSEHHSTKKARRRSISVG